MNISRIAALAAAATLLLGYTSAGATTIGTITLLDGATILQVTDATAGATDGGLATADTRTIYYYAPDFGDPAPNLHDFTGTTWPYVFTDGSLTVDASISADVTTFNSGVGELILINGNPIYQFINDNSSLDANGNFGPWFFITPTGMATQSTVPIPPAFLLFSGALAGLGVLRRRVR